MPYSGPNIKIRNGDGSIFWDNSPTSKFECTYIHKNGNRVYIEEDGLKLTYKGRGGYPIDSWDAAGPGEEWVWEAVDGTMFCRRDTNSTWHRDAAGNVTTVHANGKYKYKSVQGVITEGQLDRR